MRNLIIILIDISIVVIGIMSFPLVEHSALDNIPENIGNGGAVLVVMIYEYLFMLFVIVPTAIWLINTIYFEIFKEKKKENISNKKIDENKDEICTK